MNSSALYCTNINIISPCPVASRSSAPPSDAGHCHPRLNHKTRCILCIAYGIWWPLSIVKCEICRMISSYSLFLSKNLSLKNKKCTKPNQCRWCAAESALRWEFPTLPVHIQSCQDLLRPWKQDNTSHTFTYSWPSELFQTNLPICMFDTFETFQMLQEEMVKFTSSLVTPYNRSADVSGYMLVPPPENLGTGVDASELALRTMFSQTQSESKNTETQSTKEIQRDLPRSSASQLDSALGRDIAHRRQTKYEASTLSSSKEPAWARIFKIYIPA